jgi:hypothetical protein
MRELAAECAFVSDRLDNLLTAIQLRAGMLAQCSDEPTIEGLRKILKDAEEAATYSAHLHELSVAKLNS